jgi:hypothetical protein
MYWRSAFGTLLATTNWFNAVAGVTSWARETSTTAVAMAPLLVGSALSVAISEEYGDASAGPYSTSGVTEVVSPLPAREVTLPSRRLIVLLCFFFARRVWNQHESR